MKRWATITLPACLLLLSGCSSQQAASATQDAISVAIGPAAVTLAGGASQIFAATAVSDLSNAGVTWSIGNGVGAIATSTSTSATYTAPTGLAAATDVTLTATSKTDSTKSASASIMVSASSVPVSVAINPPAITLGGSVTQTFAATVTNDASNAGVTWSLGAGIGALSATTSTSVTYTAPADCLPRLPQP